MSPRNQPKLLIIMMKKYSMGLLSIKNYLVFGSILLMTSFLFSNQALAQGSVDIIYEADPLFSDLNILPGDESIKWVDVKNGRDEDLSVRVVVDSFEDDDSLGSQMEISIYSGSEIFYSDTLKNFFSNGEVDLLSIPKETEKQYDFKINFLNTTGNDYQGKSLNFNISIAVEGEESGSSEPISSSGSRSGLFVKPEAPIVKGEEGFPELFIDKESSSPFVYSGGQVEYTINIENRGNLAAYDAILNDNLPNGFSFTSTGQNEKTWKLGNISPNEHKTITYLVDVGKEVESGAYNNFASLYAANHDKINASKSIEVEKENVKVLGIEYELPATGFSVREFVLLLSVLFGLILSIFFLKTRAD